MTLKEKMDELDEKLSLLKTLDEKIDCYLVAKAIFHQQSIKNDFNQFDFQDIEKFDIYCDLGIELLETLKKRQKIAPLQQQDQVNSDGGYDSAFEEQDAGENIISKMLGKENVYWIKDEETGKLEPEHLYFANDESRQSFQERQKLQNLNNTLFKSTSVTTQRQRAFVFHYLFKESGLYSNDKSKTTLAKFICMIFDKNFTQIKNENYYLFLRQAENPEGTLEQIRCLEAIRQSFVNAQLTDIVNDIDADILRFKNGNED